MQKVFSFLFLFFLLTACTGEELQHETVSELVVEGWIEAGDFFTTDKTVLYSLVNSTGGISHHTYTLLEGCAVRLEKTIHST